MDNKTAAKIWDFDTSGDAYDACNYDDEIKTGDILRVLSENVIGLADAWPVAITAEAGQFHTTPCGELGGYLANNAMTQNLLEACALAEELGFELCEEMA